MKGFKKIGVVGFLIVILFPLIGDDHSFCQSVKKSRPGSASYGGRQEHAVCADRLPRNLGELQLGISRLKLRAAFTDTSKSFGSRNYGGVFGLDRVLNGCCLVVNGTFRTRPISLKVSKLKGLNSIVLERYWYSTGQRLADYVRNVFVVFYKDQAIWIALRIKHPYFYRRVFNQIAQSHKGCFINKKSITGKTGLRRIATEWSFANDGRTGMTLMQSRYIGSEHDSFWIFLYDVKGVQHVKEQIIDRRHQLDRKTNLAVRDLLRSPGKTSVTPLTKEKKEVHQSLLDEQLRSCISRRKGEGLKKLIKDGANANARYGNRNSTVLMRAVERNLPQAVEILLEAGADPNAKNSDGRTALRTAAAKGYVGIARSLLRGGADIELATPLMSAAAHGHLDMVRLLLAFGADVNRFARFRMLPMTPLMAAAEGGHLKVVKILVSKGADINKRGGGFHGSSSALGFVSSMRHSPKHKEVMDFLLSRGAE